MKFHGKSAQGRFFDAQSIALQRGDFGKIVICNPGPWSRSSSVVGLLPGGDLISLVFGCILNHSIVNMFGAHGFVLMVFESLVRFSRC